MEDYLPSIPRRRVFFMSVMAILCTLVVWLLFTFGAAILSGLGRYPADSAGWGLLYFVASLIRILPMLLVSHAILQLLWRPVFKLLTQASIELPLSAMLTTGLLLALPFLIAVSLVGRVVFVFFPLSSTLISLASGVWMARYYSRVREEASLA